MDSDLFDELKAYVGFGDQDAANLRDLATPSSQLTPVVVDRFYEILLEDPGARAVLANDAVVERLKKVLANWLRELFDGQYDERYYRSRSRIGHSHVRVGLPQRYMPLAMEVARAELTRGLRGARIADLDEKLDSLQKLLILDLTIMLGSYKESYTKQIREAEQRAMEGKLARTEHLAEIGQLAASLAHEIKNPLAGISGAIQIIGESLSADSPFKSIVRDILAQISRLDATVKDLLQYARPTPPTLKTVKLKELVLHVVSVLHEEPALRKVRVRFQGANAVIDADEAQLEQLLMNLILNAAHASAEGAAIDVTASDGEDHVALTVKDSGAGMSPAVRARALEPFYTTKAKGTGLGLAICRRIAEAHGGTISIESEPGQGTTIIVRLPRKDRKPETESN